MKLLFLIAAYLTFFCITLDAGAQPLGSTKHPYAFRRSLIEPTIFVDGIISSGEFDSHPAFTPDGKTIYFVRSSPNFKLWTILVSRYSGGKWSEPEIAPFSGQYSDADPFITADGKRLYFISNRPVVGRKPKDLDIWVVELNRKDSTTLGEPSILGSPVNSVGAEWYPTLALDGTIYFGSDRPGGRGATDLYRSRFVNGKYVQPENLGEVINTSLNEFEPYISSDEKLLFFMAGGRGDGLGGFDLYVTLNRDGGWTKPMNLGDKINSPGNEYSPMISPDGRYFFWTSTRGFTDNPLAARFSYRQLMNRLRSPRNGLGDIYQIDISVLGIGK